ncbi:MAG TPA: S8 family serine peptidase [Alphaproteobacteria bacterium]|nr:S8 family serine peptidase [Alphaproteobacteria bacterium]
MSRATHPPPPVAALEAAWALVDRPDYRKLMASAQQSLEVRVTGEGAALAGIKVVFYLRDAGGMIWAARGKTDGRGRVRQRVPAGFTVAFVRAVPYAGFWSALRRIAPRARAVTIACPRHVEAGRGGGAWWHRVLGVDTRDAARGAGIRVGVLDTGCGPHPNLRHVVSVGVFEQGRWRRRAKAVDVDPQGHGTHTTGIIGARPRRRGDYAGLAPGCALFHARVCKSREEDIAPRSVARAIRVLARDYACDLINMSLGGGPPSKAEKAAIAYAFARGTLCICSAGNTSRSSNGRLSSKVDHPAAFRQCVAVSAIGRAGRPRAPAGTWSAHQRPQSKAHRGRDGLFLAATSKFGMRLACAAPGVGIVSTVPKRVRVRVRRPYMEMDGASMASAAACGALAVILSRNGGYLSLPRNGARAAAARSLLVAHCRSLGLAAKYQGHGHPRA